MPPATATLKKGEWSGELSSVTRTGRCWTWVSHWTLVRDDAGQRSPSWRSIPMSLNRKKLEQQFLRAQRMESIGTLAGGVPMT